MMVESSLRENQFKVLKIYSRKKNKENQEREITQNNK